MEKYNLKTVSIIPVGDKDTYGNQAYNVGFDNGEAGFFKCKEQNLFKIGEASHFYMGQVEGKAGAMYNKIQRVSAVEGDFQKKSSQDGTSEPGNVKSKETSEMINRSVAIKAACELLAQSNNNTPGLALEAAERFFDYIQFGITDAQPASVAETLKKETDELPFD